MNWVEGLGYLASVLCVVALGMRQVVRLRTISFIGGVVFVAYGLLIGSWPVVLTNGAIAILNVWRLGQELRSTPTGAPAEIAAVPIEPHHPFLDDFLRANLPDIQRSQPDFDLADEPEFARLITRHGLPAGVFLGRPQATELHVVLDYVTPRYRDSRSGRWLFGEGRSTFTEAGFQRIVASPRTYEHRTYLEALGFHPEGSHLVKEL
nr:YgjV family protein [Propionibacterium sp.]